MCPTILTEAAPEDFAVDAACVKTLSASVVMSHLLKPKKIMNCLTTGGGGGGGVTDHGLLTGLGDDDHAQYHNNARGDARYTPINPLTLGINATADATNRLSVGSAASLFSHAGTGGHQIKVNKASATDTASFLFQDAFSGRAEIGLTGDDDFHFKVSPNGSTFNEAIIIDRTTGACTFPNTSFGGGGVTDGDKGDVTVSGTGTVWTVDANTITNAKAADVPTATFKGRTTAATGDPEDLTVAQAKALLNLTGTNTGDQTSIVGITGTRAQFDTAVSDADIMYIGDAPTAHTHTSANITDFNEAAQDAVGTIVDASLVYNDATPTLSRAALTGAVTASAGSNAILLGSFTTAQLNTALSDNDVATGGGTVTGASSGTNTGDNAVNTLYSALVTNATHTGDATGATALTLATVNANVGSFGLAASVSQLTVNAKGLITAAANVAIAVASAAITDSTAAGRAMLTAASVAAQTALLNVFTSTEKGLAPLSGGGTTNFLRADGTWAAPGGGGGVTDGDKGDITVSGTGTVWTVDANTITTAKIADNNVTLAKLEDAGAYTLLLRNAATTGDPAYVKISDLTDRTAVGAGDKLMIEESTGELRKIDWSDLPGAGGGISNGYATMTDGTTAANAVGGDTFKLRAGAGLRVATQNDDATHGDNAKFDIDQRQSPYVSTDFMLSGTGSTNSPFNLTVISTGTITTTPAAGVVDLNHPGVLLVRSSTTANSGALFSTTTVYVRIGGGEQFDCVFRTPAALANLTYRMGMQDAVTSADSIDGCYFEMTGGTGVITGKTANNSVRTTSAAIATLAVNTWYHARMIVNANATAVDFYIYDMAGAVLGTVQITTNIPTASGREVGITGVFTNGTTTAVDIVNLDFVSYQYPGRRLQRGALT